MDKIIVKVCKKHGELTAEQTRKRKDKSNMIMCFLCMQERLKRSYEKNHANRLEQASEYREIHKVRIAEWARNDRKAKPEKYKAYQADGHGRGYSKRLYDLLTSYGLTKERHDKMVAVQNNCCAICKQSEMRIDAYSGEIARLCIDHDHRTNAVRMLLCSECNAGIGFFRENTGVMEKAIAYLIKHSEAA